MLRTFAGRRTTVSVCHLCPVTARRSISTARPELACEASRTQDTRTNKKRQPAQRINSNEGGDPLKHRQNFSYGAIVADFAARKIPLSRKERQAILLLQAHAAAHDQSSASHRAAGHTRSPHASSVSLPPGRADTPAVHRVARCSAGKHASAALGQRSRAERLAQVQHFFDVTRASSAPPCLAPARATRRVEPPTHRAPGHGDDGCLGFSARHKPGRSWSVMAGRPVFSFGQFLAAQQPAQAPAPQAASEKCRVSARRVALQHFLDTVNPA